eukprot:752774-Prorocentrum_minimum.AAC.1
MARRRKRLEQREPARRYGTVPSRTLDGRSRFYPHLPLDRLPHDPVTHPSRLSRRPFPLSSTIKNSKRSILDSEFAPHRPALRCT